VLVEAEGDEEEYRPLPWLRKSCQGRKEMSAHVVGVECEHRERTGMPALVLTPAPTRKTPFFDFAMEVTIRSRALVVARASAPGRSRSMVCIVWREWEEGKRETSRVTRRRRERGKFRTRRDEVEERVSLSSLFERAAGQCL
jgi:hypothetical protein